MRGNPGLAVGKVMTIEELKGVILNYAWDHEEMSVDYDMVFDFLVKFDLLKESPVLRVVKEDCDEVL
jgi:hypothetical protein